ncbi:MAG: hypothetical protein A4E73_01118 [Syntrophaceae bacterium PtaU1.Bin231]|nr:MAG: hypothetical protein A4E73_01118 [Syntrophaceae bacterium PtaU1.Bin231]
MDTEPHTPHDPHPVLHGQGEPREAVGLGDGNVDQLVRLEDLAVEGPGLQGRPVDPDVPVLPAVHDDHLGPRRGGRIGDPALPVAASCVVHGVVEDADLLRTRLEAQLCQGAHDLGVGGRRVLGVAVPADVGFQDHHIAPGDKALHPPQGIQGRPHNLRRRGSPGHDEVRPPGGLRDAPQHGKAAGQRKSRRGNGRPLQKVAPLHAAPPHRRGLRYHGRRPEVNRKGRLCFSRVSRLW